MDDVDDDDDSSSFVVAVCLNDQQSTPRLLTTTTCVAVETHKKQKDVKEVHLNGLLLVSHRSPPPLKYKRQRVANDIILLIIERVDHGQATHQTQTSSTVVVSGTSGIWYLDPFCQYNIWPIFEPIFLPTFGHPTTVPPLKC
eukprot:scaffold1287_cov150-Chaetoceros_neogracile.AAC.2